MEYSIPQRIRLVKLYYQNNCSVVQTQRSFAAMSNRIQRKPSNKMINRLINRFETTGSVLDVKQKTRQRSVRNTEIIDRVHQDVVQDPDTSTRKRASQLEISRTSLRNILKKDLKMKPYKIQMAQALNPPDYEKRVLYSRLLLAKFREDPAFGDKSIWTDEAHFQLNCNVNKQNMRIWGTENPRVVIQKMLYPPKVTVW